MIRRPLWFPPDLVRRIKCLPGSRSSADEVCLDEVKPSRCLLVITQTPSAASVGTSETHRVRRLRRSFNGSRGASFRRPPSTSVRRCRGTTSLFSKRERITRNSIFYSPFGHLRFPPSGPFGPGSVDARRRTHVFDGTDISGVLPCWNL